MDRVLAYQKLQVFRTIDKGLIHLWHEKHCDQSLSQTQKVECENSKIAYEGTKFQLVSHALLLPSLEDDVGLAGRATTALRSIPL